MQHSSPLIGAVAKGLARGGLARRPPPGAPCRPLRAPGATHRHRLIGRAGGVGSWQRGVGNAPCALRARARRQFHQRLLVHQRPVAPSQCPRLDHLGSSAGGSGGACVHGAQATGSRGREHCVGTCARHLRSQATPESVAHLLHGFGGLPRSAGVCAGGSGGACVYRSRKQGSQTAARWNGGAAPSVACNCLLLAPAASAANSRDHCRLHLPRQRRKGFQERAQSGPA